MKQIEGTATITIKKLDELRKYEKWYTDLRRDISRITKRIETPKKIEYYNNICEDIMSKGQIEKEISQAAKEIKIIVSEKRLHELIQQHTDEELSPLNFFLTNTMLPKEFEKIELILEKDEQN